MWPAIHTNKCHHTYSYPILSIYKSFSRELSLFLIIIEIIKIVSYQTETNDMINVRTIKYLFTNPFLENYPGSYHKIIKSSAIRQKQMI
jgi:hypothetical protein